MEFLLSVLVYGTYSMLYSYRRFCSFDLHLTYMASTCHVVCVVIPFTLDVRLVDAPAGEEGHIGFLHLPSAVLGLIFLSRRIQPSLALVDREVEFCVLTK